MRNILTIAATILALCAASIAVPASATAKAAPHYDCTKKGNANKAACKAAAASQTATTPATETAPAAPAKKPGLMSKLMHPPAKPAPAASTPAAPVTPAPAASTTAAATTPAKAHPVCKKGKPCGNSCIAMDKVCHK